MKNKSIFLIILFLAIFSNITMAKDNELIAAMIDLERKFIPAVFLSSKTNLQKAEGSFINYKTEWENFEATYKDYRGSSKNWGNYFKDVTKHIAFIVTLYGDDNIPAAHLELEKIRTLMREFRRSNGFPKFATDEFTAFHSIMGEIIDLASTKINIDTIEALLELYKDASHAWSKVEKNNIDWYVWKDINPDLIALYPEYIKKEREALISFEQSLYDSEDISDAAKGLKLPQACGYLVLGGINFPPSADCITKFQ